MPLLCPSCFEPKGDSDPTFGLCPKCAEELARELGMPGAVPVVGEIDDEEIPY